MSDSGDRDTNVCATSFQFQTPTSVLTSSSLIMNDRTVTPKDNPSVQGIYLSWVRCGNLSLLCHRVYHVFNLLTIQRCHY